MSVWKQKLLEALFGVLKDQSVQKDLSCRGAEESMVALFGDVDTHDQMLRRSANLVLQLTEFLEPATIILIH